MIVNPNVPRGLVPVQGLGAAATTGGLRAYVHDAGDGTALFPGDPVKLAGANTTVRGQTLAQVIRAASGDVIVGVVVAVEPDTRDSTLHVAASTTRIVLVNDDPNALFEIQDENAGTALTDAAVGLNVNFKGSGGNTTYGLSNVVLDNTSEATTNTLDLKIVGIVNRVDNVSGTAAARYLVRINRHQYANQVAGV